MNRITLCLIIMFFPSFLVAQELSIHSSQRIVSIKLSQEDFDAFNQGDFNLKKHTNFIYEQFRDSFDIICFVINNKYIPNSLGFAGKSIKISNDIEGIGQSIFDDSNLYGSSGRLKQIIILTRNDFILYGPSLHEIAHNWANYGIKTSGFYNNKEIVDYRLHWGFSGCGGQLGGFLQKNLIENYKGITNRYKANNGKGTIFGLNANGGNSIRYSDFELYLMGLMNISDLSPFSVFSQITMFEGDSVFDAKIKTDYNKERILQVLGNRVPNDSNSQKQFRILFAVVTPTELTYDEWELVDQHVEIFTREGWDGDSNLYNFYEATRGNAIIKADNLYNCQKTSTHIKNHKTWLKNFKIYPTPTTGLINISEFETDYKYQVSIMDISGNEILRIKNVSKDLELDLTDKPSGIYNLLIRKGDKLSTYQIIKK
ncbi:MAG: T9SS type A sorting domain-containing protein [bacterium]